MEPGRPFSAMTLSPWLDLSTFLALIWEITFFEEILIYF